MLLLYSGGAFGNSLARVGSFVTPSLLLVLVVEVQVLYVGPCDVFPPALLHQVHWKRTKAGGSDLLRFIHEPSAHAHKPPHIAAVGVGRFFLQGGGTGAIFPKFFQGVAKVQKFVFSNSKLRKQPFLLKFSKSRGGLCPLPTSNDGQPRKKNGREVGFDGTRKFLSGLRFSRHCT